MSKDGSGQKAGGKEGKETYVIRGPSELFLHEDVGLRPSMFGTFGNLRETVYLPAEDLHWTSDIEDAFELPRVSGFNPIDMLRIRKVDAGNGDLDPTAPGYWESYERVLKGSPIDSDPSTFLHITSNKSGERLWAQKIDVYPKGYDGTVITWSRRAEDALAIPNSHFLMSALAKTGFGPSLIPALIPAPVGSEGRPAAIEGKTPDHQGQVRIKPSKRAKRKITLEEQARHLKEADERLKENCQVADVELGYLESMTADDLCYAAERVVLQERSKRRLVLKIEKLQAELARVGERLKKDEAFRHALVEIVDRRLTTADALCNLKVPRK